MNKKNAGFTLIELLVSISIIAILTVLVSFSFSSAQKKARDSRRVMDMTSLQKAAELYYGASSYSYPGTVAVPWVTTGTGETILPIYPTDPKGTGWTGYSGTTMTVDGYCICAAMENLTGGNSTTNTCAFASSGPYFCVKNRQ